MATHFILQELVFHQWVVIMEILQDIVRLNIKENLRDRKFEPDTYNNGVFLSAWNIQNTSKDWFQVLDNTGIVRFQVISVVIL